MTEQLRQRCDLFFDNYQTVKGFARWEYGMMYYLCAYLYTRQGKKFDAAKVDECRKMIKQKEGPFSQFRNALSLSVACELSLEEDPEEVFDLAKKAYDTLREEFTSSAYLPLAAITLARAVAEDEFAEKAARARAVYDQMKKSHAFLTGAEDVPFAVLFALGDRAQESISADVEAAYLRLREKFYVSNALQSVSHCLSLEGDSVQNAERLIALWQELKDCRHRYGVDLELVTLAALASGQGASAAQIAEVSDYLSGKKGFGNWALGQRQRLMYAASLVGLECGADADATAINGAAGVILQQATTISIMAAMVVQATNAATNS